MYSCQWLKTKGSRAPSFARKMLSVPVRWVSPAGSEQCWWLCLSGLTQLSWRDLVLRLQMKELHKAHRHGLHAFGASCLQAQIGIFYCFKWCVMKWLKTSLHGIKSSGECDIINYLVLPALMGVFSTCTQGTAGKSCLLQLRLYVEKQWGFDHNIDMFREPASGRESVECPALGCILVT